MRTFHRYHLLLFASLLLGSCLGDASKNISTDQAAEGTEVFRVSQCLEESLFFALQGFEFYQASQADTLPGCPQVEINESEKTVSLVFSQNTSCPNANSMPRSGRIFLQFINRSLFESSVILTYDNYTFKGNRIDGLREFKRMTNLVNPNRRTEVFENLIIVNGNNSSSRINGSFIHQLRFENSKLVDFTSGGILDGRNIAGRQMKMTQKALRVYDVSCILSGVLLPKQGEEEWEFMHGSGQMYTHNLSFSSSTPCTYFANIELQDGRTLVFP